MPLRVVGRSAAWADYRLSKGGIPPNEYVVMIQEDMKVLECRDWPTHDEYEHDMGLLETGTSTVREFGISLRG
jgi:hypothetical protein